ncbi:uncharacterized protein LOC123556237 [Mercenaria mercenaria]|uniref:uncharacterized protein LOC123556237 n=1 Tax=Mercenaria mercenaria TaxID=6596 RepID=UPI00234E4486|nr:uncharacterized protein LOC123556237 [Mercenaria mercenaria]
MATGHILPGYGNPVTRLRRAQSAYPLDKQKLQELTARNVPDLDPRTLDHIRENARNMWLRPRYDSTTYNTFHTGDQLDAPTEPQPTEPLRRHKPHPKPVFLTNRLHYVPGYHNADATMGKPVYRIDDTFTDEERQLRRHQREKYIARPRTAAVDQYHEPWAQLTDAVGPVEAWGAQAWLKMADDDHQHEVVNAIRDYQDKELFNTAKALPNHTHFQKNVKIQTQDSQYEHQHNFEQAKQINVEYNKKTETTGGTHNENQKNHEEIAVKSNIKQEGSNQKMLKEIAKNFAFAKGKNIPQTKSNVETLQQKVTMPEKKSSTGDKLQKKAFPLKVTMPTENGVINKVEVEKIISYINNKVYRGENKKHESVAKQQAVKFRSPVQTSEQSPQHYKKEGKVAENETNDKETSDSSMKNKNPIDESRVILKYQSPVPPPVADATPRPHTAIPSMHRWMKGAGATESEQVRRILYGGYPPSTIQPLGNLGYPSTMLQRRQQDADNVRKARYINKYPRGDFLIHPEYPPSFPHHRID